jgi:menaquinone-dependent protoporphyrinogen oxidase
MTRILVVFGTTEGHTEMIAAAIGHALTARGIDVNVIQAGTIDPRPADYDGVIVAASVHRGQHQPAVGQWISAHLAELRLKPAAFVSAGLAVLPHDADGAAADENVHRFLDALGWQPAVVKTVAGALPYSRHNLLARWSIRRIAARLGGDTDTSRDYDYTDWADLELFADGFAKRVAGTTPARSDSMPAPSARPR